MLIRFAVKEFMSEKEFENVSPNTLKAYSMLFEDFLEWCEGQGYERINELTSRSLKSYLLMCKTEKGNNATSINTKRKLFRTWFNFLVEETIVEENPTDKIKKSREDIRIKTFSDDEVKAILSHLRRTRRKEDSFYSVRNYTMFLLLIGTGLRASEAVSIKWSDIDIERGSLKVFGKMRKEEIVPLSGSLCRELAFWKEYCSSKFIEVSPYVFVNQKNQKYTIDGLKNWFKRLAKQMSFPDTRCSAHSCRHYFAKVWIQNGGDISTLAKVLRHTSIKTTERYLQFWGNEVADDNEKYNPLNKLGI